MDDGRPGAGLRPDDGPSLSDRCHIATCSNVAIANDTTFLGIFPVRNHDRAVFNPDGLFLPLPPPQLPDHGQRQGDAVRLAAGNRELARVFGDLHASLLAMVFMWILGGMMKRDNYVIVT